MKLVMTYVFSLVVLTAVNFADCAMNCESGWFHNSKLQICMYVFNSKSIHQEANIACNQKSSNLPLAKSNKELHEFTRVLQHFNRYKPVFWTNFKLSIDNSSQIITVKDAQNNVITDCLECNAIISHGTINGLFASSEELCIMVNSTGAKVIWETKPCHTQYNFWCYKDHDAIAEGSPLSRPDLAAIMIAVIIVITMIITVIVSIKVCPEHDDKRLHTKRIE